MLTHRYVSLANYRGQDKDMIPYTQWVAVAGSKHEVNVKSIWTSLPDMEYLGRLPVNYLPRYLGSYTK